MHTEVIEQRYFKDTEGKARCIDIMQMNKDTWESEVPAGWKSISEKEADKIANPPLTHEQHVAIAESQKQALIAEASQKTQLWQTQLMLGIITEEDKASLKEWMLYVQEVQAVDPSLGAAVVWPTPPASPAR
ncbi:tail fiber assembly protein [Morganella morganii]|uniref:tail fiber assembly protein n=1 Tax=Morganella morganii TaxID=582 RepID=UPI001F52359B|nr:tail fiber assembly protein [Morganella morganii]